MSLGSNALGTNALGTTDSSVAANLSCSLTSVSTVTASLTTAVKLAAAVVATSTLTAALTTGQGNLSANLSASASATASLTTHINFVANLSCLSSVAATLASAQVAPSFTPSVARTIYVQAAAPVFTGGKWWNLTDPKKPHGLKDPDATIDITFDWSNWLDDIGSADISDMSFTLFGLNNGGTFYDDTKATVFVSGGVVGSVTTIACKIKTNTNPSRTDERTVYIDILDE